jgi:hypothetical protein
MVKLSTPILLLIECEGKEPRFEEFCEHIIKIGKLSSVNLRLDDPNINRIHAVIEVMGEEEAQIIDMGSSKGTRVNGKRIHKSRLVSGDQIILGDTHIKIYLGANAVAQARGGGSWSESAANADVPATSGSVVGSNASGIDAMFQNMAMPGLDGLDLELSNTGDEGSTQVTQSPLLASSAQKHISMQQQNQAGEFSGDDTAAVSDEVAAQVIQASMNNNVYVNQDLASDNLSHQSDDDVDYADAHHTPAQPSTYDSHYGYGQAAQQMANSNYGQAAQQMANSNYGQAAQQMANVKSVPIENHQQSHYVGANVGVPSQTPFTGGFAPVVAQQVQFQQPQVQANQWAMPPMAAPQPSANMYATPSISSLPLSAGPSPLIGLNDAELADAQEVLEVRVLWGDTILDHNHFYEPKRITIGDSRKNTFSISSEALPPELDCFTLIETEGERLLINFTEKMGGELLLKDQVIPLHEIKQSAKVQRTQNGYQFALPAQSKVRLFLSQDLVFEISFVPAPKRLPVAILHQLDHHLARAMGTSFLIHGILILLMLFSDETAQNLDEGYLRQSNRFAQMIIRPEEPEKKKEMKQESGGAKAKGDEGKMGKPKATELDRRAGQKQINPDATSPINIDKNVERQIMDRLQKSGMLGLLSGGASRGGGIITAKGFGGDDLDALGGHHGLRVGDGFGSGGLGTGGVGTGGGGFSGSSVGLGRIGTYGRGGGKGGRNWGSSKLRDKRTRQITVSTGPPAIFGGLDREIIRRIINQHRSRFKYCYERELIKLPTLNGNINVWFRIEPDGRVHQSKISRTTMNNDRVEECLVDRIKHLRFPSPKGGGVVDVNYPFIFRPS